MRSRVLIILLPLTLGFAGCLGPEPLTTSKKEFQTRSTLKSKNEAIKGTYRGQAWEDSEAAEPYPIEIRLYEVEELNGTNENGEKVFRPALKAYFERKDYEDSSVGDYLLAVRWVEETGELIMESERSQPLPGRNPGVGYLSISATLRYGLIDGEIRDHRGPQGHIRLEKVENSAPKNDDSSTGTEDGTPGRK